MQDIEHVIKRSRRYWFVDGITELYMGSISLLGGLFYLGCEGINALVIFLFVPTQAKPLFLSPWALPVATSYIILLAAFFWLTLFVQQRATKFRESFTYPRIGYLSPRTSQRAPNIILANIFIGIQLLYAYMFINNLEALISDYISPNVLLFVGCLFFSFLYLYPAISLALTRFYILSTLSTLLSIVLFQTSIRPGMNMVLYTTLMGVALLISGGFTFRSFSRQNPLHKEELVISNDLSNAAQDIDGNMTNEEIQGIIKRSPRYWYLDGLADLHFGSLLLLPGLLMLVGVGSSALINSFVPSTRSQPSLLTSSQISLIQNCLIFILPVLFFCLFLISMRRITWLRERFSYPRIAYIESRNPAPQLPLKLKKFKLIFVACSLVLLLIWMIIFPFVPRNIIPLVANLFLSFSFLYPALSLTVNRFYILTALSILLSIVLFQSKINGYVGLVFYQTLMGVALIVSGELTFRNFVRQNPLPKEEL